MQPETVQSIIATARDAWIEGNAEQFAELFTEDGEFVVPGQVWRGKSAIRDALADFARSGSEVDIAIQRIMVDGNQAVVEWHWRETNPQTGKQTTAEDAIVVDFRDGQISRWREYIDNKS
ncbi:MAG: nuclear transport factor 2 family protein [Synechococcales cyanobacterium C42_A2020_086]|nr:nuclear transport factor 2 family protein [Synechococcales cyanobacterium M58_A2018_015]MBF2074486.1 nuclear transport factor 2 family protein [Synechococcales cyanobacterium C42_A2020_086]